MKNLSNNIEKLLWDSNKESLNTHQVILIERILNYGDVEDFKWLLNNFEKDLIVNFINTQGKKRLNRKSYHFWSNYFGTQYSMEHSSKSTTLTFGEDRWY